MCGVELGGGGGIFGGEGLTRVWIFSVQLHLTSCNRPFQYGFCTVDSLTFEPFSNASSSISELISCIFLINSIADSALANLAPKKYLYQLL